MIVLGVAWLGVGVSLASNRPDPPGFTAPASAADPVAQPTQVLIIGDSYTGGSDMGGNGDAGWARLATADLIGQGYDIVTKINAGGGSGYGQGGQRNLTFEQLAAESGGGYELVVFFGSRNDTKDISQAARSALATAKAASPSATLLVIGPPWVDDNPPKTIISDRDALATAAAEVGATFVDPLAESWFTGDAKRLVGADGVHPTDEGHRYMADLIRPHMQAELDALAADPPA